MAATWNVKITVLDIDSKKIRVVAIRTDGGKVRIYTVHSVVIDSQAAKKGVMNMIWNRYRAEIAQEAASADVIGDLEALAKTNLEGRE